MMQEYSLAWPDPIFAQGRYRFQYMARPYFRARALSLSVYTESDNALARKYTESDNALARK